MIRTFVAIALPENLQELLRKTSTDLRRLDLDARYPRPESIHLTLKFLGDIDEERVSELAAALGEISDLSPFSVAVEKLGIFPHLGNPRVVWVGIEQNAELSRLQQEIEGRLERLGFPKDDRPFRPHLTLARIKSRRNVAALARLIREQGNETDLGKVLVDRFHLYKSILKPDGARYEKLSSIELRGE